MLFATITRDLATGPFFDAAARGVLLLRRCDACGEWHGPAADRCGACGSDEELTWAESSGRGTVVTWGVVHPRPSKDGTPSETTVIGMVEVDEGPWLSLQLRDVDAATLSIGDAVQVAFDLGAGDEPVPYFTPRP